jgi:hypothetical protein
MTENATDQETVEDAPAETEAPVQEPGLAWDLVDGERIWLGTQTRPWRSLAVVSGADGLSTYEVARLITHLGGQHGESIDLADVRDVPLNRVSAVLAVARSLVDRGDRVVFATRSIQENIAAVSCARAADCVVLCVSLGTTSIGLVEETIRLIGKESFLGSILLHPSKEVAPLSSDDGVRRLEAAS